MTSVGVRVKKHEHKHICPVVRGASTPYVCETIKGCPVGSKLRHAKEIAQVRDEMRHDLRFSSQSQAIHLSSLPKDDQQKKLQDELAIACRKIREREEEMGAKRNKACFESHPNKVQAQHPNKVQAQQIQFQQGPSKRLVDEMSREELVQELKIVGVEEQLIKRRRKNIEFNISLFDNGDLAIVE